jgi:ATPase subunit of ABC transporter with duplicated ATPase domains
MLDLNAIAWLEDYLQTWPGTILVVYVTPPACMEES